MKLRTIFAWALSGMCGAPLLNSRAQGVLDQSFEPVTPNIFAVNFSGFAPGQTFTVGISGNLVGVDVFIARNELQTDGDISWALTANGQSGVLASGSFPYANLSFNYSFQSCLVPPGAVVVNPGDVLAITLSSSHQFTWAGNDNNPYPNGSEVGAPFYDDLGFRTYVASIPEPSSVGLLCLAALIGLGRRRRDSPERA